MLKRKEKILIGALELLEAGGINGLTTKKLAAQQGVSEPALYRQFKSKQDIVKALIVEYASFDEKIMNTITESGMSGKKAIEFYVMRFVERYRNYPEITTIMYSMDVYYYNEDTKLMMKDIHQRRLNFLRLIVGAGQQLGDVDTHFSPEELAKLIDGVIYSQVYAWRIGDYQEHLVDQILLMIQKLI